MAVEVMNEVWEHAPERGLELTILLAIADNADGATRRAWPSEAYLAYKSRCSERSVRRIVAVLEAAGAIAVHRREGRPNVYTVAPQTGRQGALQGWRKTREAAGDPGQVDRGTPDKLTGVQARKLSTTPDTAMAGDPGHSYVRGTIKNRQENPRAVARGGPAAAGGPGGTPGEDPLDPGWLIDRFVATHKQRLGLPYLVVRGRDGKHAKEAMRVYTRPQLEAALSAYFADPRHYTIGASIPLFTQKVPVLLTSAHRAVGRRLEQESAARRAEASEREPAPRRPAVPPSKRQDLLRLTQDLALRRISEDEFNQRVALLRVG